LTCAETHWRRVLFDEPAVLTHQTIDGELVGVPASSERVDLNGFALRNGGANWVQNYL
jgi:hypothetical protein